MNARHLALSVVLLAGLALLWAGCQNPALTGAKVYIQQQDWDNARKQLELAVQQEPNNAEAHYLLGRAYGEEGRYEEMVAEFQTSLSISQRWKDDIQRMTQEKWTMAFNRGVQAGKDEDYEKALEEFKTATIIDPTNPDAYNNLGFAYTNLDRLDEALDAYGKVLELDQNNVAARINSGVIYFKKDQAEKAAKMFQRALEIDAGNKSALTMWTLSLETLADEQRRDLAQATTKDDSLRVMETVKKTLNEAAEVYRQAIEAHPEEKNFVYNLGVLYASKLRNYQAAEPLFKKVTELDPEDVDAWFNLATAQLNTDDLDGALVSLEKAVELTPDNPDVWYQLGIIYVKKGMKEKGEEAFKRSEELSGESATQETTTIDESSIEDMPEGEAAVNRLMELGLLIKINPKMNEAHVEPALWNAILYDTKANIGRILAFYCGKEKGTDANWVEIKDAYSGKKLAKYSESWGFEVF
jgi:tetratricopeptide (TPR) repeat protein